MGVVLWARYPCDVRHTTSAPLNPSPYNLNPGATRMCNLNPRALNSGPLAWHIARGPGGFSVVVLQGCLAHGTAPPPEDHRRDPGMYLLSGPRKVPFLMSEVPLLPLPHSRSTHSPQDGFRSPRLLLLVPVSIIRPPHPNTLKPEPGVIWALRASKDPPLKGFQSSAHRRFS